MGFVVAQVTWERVLHGSNFHVGCVGYVGQNIFKWVNILHVLGGSNIFLRGSEFNIPHTRVLGHMFLSFFLKFIEIHK